MNTYVDDRLPSEAFIRLPEVSSLTGMKRSTIYARIKAGKFPPPCKLTERASAWRVGEIRKWMVDPLGWTPSRDVEGPRP